MTHSIRLGISLALVLGACGDDGNHVPLPDAPEPDAALPVTSLELFVGDLGGFGNVDGTGDAARFLSPSGVAVDSGGNLYIADSSNRTLRKVTPAGVVTTLAGTPGVQGSADGTGAAASFSGFSSVAVDSAGNVYVADFENDNIRKVTPAGVVTTFAGTAGNSGSTDATGAAASFNLPAGVAVDAAGNVYVADSANHKIRKITSARVVTTLAGSGTPGSADGTGAAATFNNPTGVATDAAGNIYVADASNQLIRKITPAGVVTTLAGSAGNSGSTDGTGAAASFSNPSAVATDTAGNVYVTDTDNQTIRRVTPAGVVTTLAGTVGVVGHADGAASSFNSPLGIALDTTGTIYVADTDNDTIRKITAAGTTTFVGSVNAQGAADGTGPAARFRFPAGIATDSAGTIYVSDTNNATIRAITPGAAVTTLVGTAGVPGSADGMGSAASFSGPNGIATDGAGNAYVADSRNNTIRKITPVGLVTTLAGLAGISSGSSSADGTGSAARFKFPVGVATDAAGNLYVTDSFNNTIRHVTAAGEVTTFAGTAGTFGTTDGAGAAARFLRPSGIVAGADGTIYVADSGNHTIRAITPAGVVTTFAGTAGTSGFADGTGVAARFSVPSGLAIDSDGNLYVADDHNHTIRKITPAGVVTTIVGVAGEATFVPGELPGRLSFPNGVAISGRDLYITFANGVAVVRNRP